MKQRNLFRKNGGASLIASNGVSSIFSIVKYLHLKFIMVLFVVSSVLVSCAKGNERINSVNQNRQSNIDHSIKNNNITYPSNDYTIWQIENSTMTVIFPLNDDVDSSVWLVQSQYSHAVESIITLNDVLFSAYNKNCIKLINDNTELVYLLTGATYENYVSNAVGLIKLKHPNLLQSLRSLSEGTKDEIINYVDGRAWCKDTPIAAAPGANDSACKCAGGYGATSCECGGSIASLSWHEAVSCGEGKYACCSGL